MKFQVVQRYCISLFLFAFINLHAQTDQLQNKTINVQEFGAVPNDNLDDTDALRNAVALARTKTDAILYFPPGRYHISDSLALKIQEEAMYGKLGSNPQDQLYVSNKEYAIGLDFKGANNLTIEAINVELICDGWMEPLSFRNCDNVTLNGITIDYKKIPNSAGKIINLGKDYVDVKFRDSDPVSQDLIMLRIMIYDLEKESLVGASVYHKKKTLIAPQTMRFYGKSVREISKAGRMLIVLSGFHYRPAILLYKSKDMVLNDVTIHSQAGMGIVGHLNENITMNRLRVVPRKGRYVSSNTDATHFATNRGFINFFDCEFGGQGDDATNVHTYYSHVISQEAPNICEYFLGDNNVTHSLYLDEPEVGDVMAIVDRNSLKELGYIRVNRFWTYPKEVKVKIEFDGELPRNKEDYFLVNISATPSLKFVNCTVKSHRARSVLVKTRKVLIEGCSFENTTGTAIHIGAEGDWGEGITSEDVIVRNNVFTNCGIGGANDGTIDGASAIAVHIKAKNTKVAGLHKRLLFENNIVTGGIHAIVVKGAADVTIRNNSFKEIEEQAIVIDASIRVKAYDNEGGRVLGEKEESSVLPNLK